MTRQKKNKQLHSEQKSEVNMSESEVVETLESLESEVDRARLELEKLKIEIDEKQRQIKTMPAREVSEDEMIIVKKQQSGFVKNAGLKEKIEKQKAYDNVIVTGKFINRRAPGQPAKLTYIKYEDDPVKWYTLEDGKVYDLPRGFVDQIREHYHTPVFNQTTQAMDPNRPAGSIHDVDTSNKKYDFVPISF